MARDSFLKLAAPLVVATFLGVYNIPLPGATESGSNAIMPELEKQQIGQSVYYAGCNEVRASGKAPLYRGDPGYREGMDGDSDGIACEPYRN
jgi:Excalibur calcium-binding domain